MPCSTIPTYRQRAALCRRVPQPSTVEALRGGVPVGGHRFEIVIVADHGAGPQLVGHLLTNPHGYRQRRDPFGPVVSVQSTWVEQVG